MTRYDNWRFDIYTLTARHVNGLTIQFERSGHSNSPLDGRVIGDMPEGIGTDQYIELFNEAWDGMLATLSQVNRH